VHELGLLASVVTAVSRAAADAGASTVEAVGLRVGTLSGAVPGALDGAWPIATFGTLLEGARLDVEVITAQVHCPRCEAERDVDEFYALRCPACGTPTGALVHGREFEVVWADLE
jgi:hydrogenase nickel incorporation protein HypA/HybF